jgi:hypothetical protein
LRIAFESALKAVLEKRHVPFRQEATASVLVQECVRADVFPRTYENSLIGIANVRDAMSDTAHGRTAATHIVPEQKNAEHLLYVSPDTPTRNQGRGGEFAGWLS